MKMSSLFQLFGIVIALSNFTACTPEPIWSDEVRNSRFQFRIGSAIEFYEDSRLYHSAEDGSLKFRESDSKQYDAANTFVTLSGTMNYTLELSDGSSQIIDRDINKTFYTNANGDYSTDIVLEHEGKVKITSVNSLNVKLSANYAGRTFSKDFNFSTSLWDIFSTLDLDQSIVGYSLSHLSTEYWESDEGSDYTDPKFPINVKTKRVDNYYHIASDIYLEQE